MIGSCKPSICDEVCPADADLRSSISLYLEKSWVVVGDEKDNRLCAIKRVNLVKSSKVKLSFASPSEEGKRKYALYFMCDSYLGADLEFEFDVAVAKGEDEEEEDDSSEEEEEEEDEDVNEDDAGKEKDAPDAVMKD
jgi:hypothetical protein